MPPVEHRGIAFGPFHLPVDQYGPEFSGTLRLTTPRLVLSDLRAARQAGARVLLSLGGQRVLRDGKGHFSLALWKQRMDRYRGIDLSPYIADGTLLGHYIMDEPHDFSNWGGTQVTLDQIEEMARYSKEIWPNVATVIRAWPDYLQGRRFKYLDAAWAQYSPGNGASRYRIPIDEFIRKNASEAQAAGLRLVVGLNMLGGSDNRGLKGYDGVRWSMSAAQVKSWGAALLEVEPSCAFLSWKYDKAYFGRADIKEALAELSEKASKLPKRSCHR